MTPGTIDIDTAVRTEREACAKLADDLAHRYRAAASEAMKDGRRWWWERAHHLRTANLMAEAAEGLEAVAKAIRSRGVAR